MRLARTSTGDGIVTGRYDDGVVSTDEDEYAVDEGRTDRSGGEGGETAEGTLVAPCDPSALYCVGRNYAATLEQMEYERPEEPDFFIKPPGSVIGPNEPIPYPTFSSEVTYAGELAAVIGERSHRIAPEDVSDAVLGYTIMNDVDALDQPGRTARKAFVGSAPLGPWIETELDPRGIEMWTDINGERRQESNTDLMLFDPFEIVSFLSERFVLEPGDVIAFGSPANPGTIEPGDEVAITYEGVGTLRNTVDAPTE
jgi:2-keto-4-pentenoate hydratase/2-oxohepta-3-ene-1,7-dioic acid hydratase in catechol pathway